MLQFGIITDCDPYNGVTGILLESTLDELMKETRLSGTRGPDDQELEQVVVGVVEAGRGLVHDL